ncbi:MAG: CHRD domain-containing protein [bacterium]|nr:CHRD domain-containing protein [bacterium]
MKKNLSWIALLCMFLVWQASQVQAALVFSVNLDGGQENPPVSTNAFGVGTLVLNDAQDRLTMNLRIEGLDFVGQGGLDTGANNVTAMHIHRAPVGTNGGVVFGLISPNHDVNNDLLITPFEGGADIFSAWDAAEGNSTTLTAQLASLLAGELYFNVHSTGFAGGEIRGQIVGVPEPSSAGAFLLVGLGLGMLRRNRR